MDWLMKLLGMQGGSGGGSPFGGLGGGGGPGGPPAPQMPMSAPTIGPGTMPNGGSITGAPLNLMPQNPGSGQNPISQLYGTLAQKFGGGVGAAPNSGQPGATPLTPSTNQNNAAQNFGFNQVGNLLKQPQIQPTQWMPWMPMR